MTKPFFKKLTNQPALITTVGAIIVAIIAGLFAFYKSSSPTNSAVASSNNSTAVVMAASTQGSNSPIIQSAPGSTVNATVNYGTQNTPRKITSEQLNKFVALTLNAPKSPIHFTIDSETRESRNYFTEITNLLLKAGYEIDYSRGMGFVSTGPHPAGLCIPYPPNGDRGLSLAEYNLVKSLEKSGVQVGPFRSGLYQTPESNSLHLIIGDNPE